MRWLVGLLLSSIAGGFGAATVLFLNDLIFHPERLEKSLGYFLVIQVYAFPISLVGTLLVLIPMTLIRRASFTETLMSYVTGGLLGGLILISIIIYAIFDAHPFEKDAIIFVICGGIAGATCGLAWWFSFRRMIVGKPQYA